MHHRSPSTNEQIVFGLGDPNLRLQVHIMSTIKNVIQSKKSRDDEYLQFLLPSACEYAMVNDVT